MESKNSPMEKIRLWTGSDLSSPFGKSRFRSTQIGSRKIQSPPGVRHIEPLWTFFCLQLQDILFCKEKRKRKWREYMRRTGYFYLHHHLSTFLERPKKKTKNGGRNKKKERDCVGGREKCEEMTNKKARNTTANKTTRSFGPAGKYIASWSPHLLVFLPEYA